MHSFVIKIAMDVKGAVLPEITIHTPGIFTDIVLDQTTDPDPIDISVINNNTFFLFKLLYFFL